MQRGQLIRRGRSWLLRYYDANGKRVYRKVAKFSDQYRTERSVRKLADEILESVNEGKDPASPQTLQKFIENHYWPYVRTKKRPSTYRGYLNLYNAQIEKRIGGIRLRDFRTIDGQRLLDRIADETELSHQSLTHIKSLLSGIFSSAKRMGALDDTNPMESVEIPKGQKSKPTHAYSLKEVETMLAALKGTARAAVMVGAWTGLSLAELRGLQWGDIASDHLTVQRTYWHRVEGPPKTDARSSAVHLLPAIVDTLAEHRKANPDTVWVFEGPYNRPLDLASLGSKQIKFALEGTGVEWHGFHALRRGLGTRLFANDVPIETVSAILRHGSVHVTRRHYVKSLPETVVAAMQGLANKK